MFLVEGVVGLVGGFLGMVIGGLIVVWFTSTASISPSP